MTTGNLEQQYSEVNTADPATGAQPDKGGQQAIPGYTGGDATMNEIKSFLAEAKAERERAAEERERADLKSTLEDLAKKTEVAKPELLKYHLAEKYDSDPAFKQVWDNRKANPDALANALEALEPEIRETFAATVDPQLRADQRAFDQSTGDTATSGSSDEHAETHRLMKLNEGEFAQEWAKLSNSGF